MSLTDEPLYCKHGRPMLDYCSACVADENEAAEAADEEAEYEEAMRNAPPWYWETGP